MPDTRSFAAGRFAFGIDGTDVVFTPAAGQTGSPEDAARSYTDAMRAGDWHGMAALMHPDALAELRQSIAETAGLLEVVPEDEADDEPEPAPSAANGAAVRA